MAIKTSGPDRPCMFTVGQLVTCDGPFNSGKDSGGWWRRVEVVVSVAWEPKQQDFKGRITGGYWRVSVAGYSEARESAFDVAPDGMKAGDICRI